MVFLLVPARQQRRDANTMALTDTAIRTSKPRAKSFKLTNARGLHLLMAPTGGKLWRFAYRFAGKQTLALGAYPSVTLAQARDGRDAARKHLTAGLDPSIKRKLDKQAAGNTFRVVAEELLKKLEREGRAPTALVKLRWLLDFAFAAFGERPIAEITAPEILYVASRQAANTKRHAVCPARAGWYSDMQSRQRGPNVIHRPICAVLLQRRR